MIYIFYTIAKTFNLSGAPWVFLNTAQGKQYLQV